MLPTLLIACVQPPNDGGPKEGADAPPTFYADVRPILDLNCARCHTDGGPAPSFDAAEDVVAMAGAIKSYTQAGVMPLAAPDPDCADYVGSERLVLADEDAAVLAAWADAGAPLGDPADAPVPVAPLSTAPFDATVAAAVPYTPEFGDADNAYRCFTVPLGNEADVFLTGMEPVLDNHALVHHVLLARDTSGETSTDPGGYACSGLGEPNWDLLGAWGPGGIPTTFPDGLGMRIPADAKLVLQIHYFAGDLGGADQTGVGLHLADAVDHEVRIDPLGPTGFTIPAGDPAYSETASYQFGPSMAGYTILGVWPHMHVLGSAFSARVLPRRSDEEVCLVRTDRYDFHNQVTVMLKEPHVLDSGMDTLEITCTWDNSADNPAQLVDPPQDVGYGEETGNEMCFGFTYGYLPE
ncbi:MAG: hypothetical protein ACOZNI_04905 [Myxococcota bacterium]